MSYREENLVQEEMATDSIFTTCRKGNLPRLRWLIETRDVDPNCRDCWDSTPLYYACLCGHEEVVSYLLSVGARCEAQTFDGERCMYGALTESIKRLLLDAKLINTNTKKRDDLDEFCESMMKAEEFSDFTLNVGNKEYKLHRCILAARCEYFRETLQSKWKNRKIRTNAISSKAFDDFVRYIYTGRLTCDYFNFDHIYRLAKKCRVRTLADNVCKAAQDVKFLKTSKNIYRVPTLMVDSPDTRNELLEDFGSLIDPGVPEEFVPNPFYRLKCFISFEWEETDTIEPIYDVCLEVEGYQFYCNKVFICTRSEFFRALVQNHFGEYKEENGILVIPLHGIKSTVFASVLYYIYTNYPIYPLTAKEDTVLEVLMAADMYLLPGLKKQCGHLLCELIALDNVLDFLVIARTHGLTKLEDSCAEFLAENITEMISNKKFRDLIILDAKEVKGREETDSIPIIDDIRYHITSQVGTFSDCEEGQTKLKVINELLIDLGLEA